LFPVFLTISFTGAFSGLTELPGFPASNIFDWFVPMTALQGCAFAGITTGMGMARDLESGFYDRLLSSPARRSALLAGPMLAGMLRAFIPLSLMLAFAWIAGASLDGGFLGVLTLVVAGLGIALVASSWALGLALRFKTTSITPLMQTGVFLSIFLSTAQMPLELITGWLHGVARVNPMTNVLALAREGFLTEVTWEGTWPGLVSLAAMMAVLLCFAALGMRKVTP
jgi:ABC-2 type transport system permease protein